MQNANDLFKIIATLEVNQYFYPYKVEDIELQSYTAHYTNGLPYQCAQFDLPNGDFLLASLETDDEGNKVLSVSKNFDDDLIFPVVSPVSELEGLKASYEDLAKGASQKYYNSKAQTVCECLAIVAGASGSRKDAAYA